MATIKKQQPKPKRGRSSKYIWDDRYFVLIYELALSGASIKAIARGIGVRMSLLGKWIDQKPALREAIHKARRPACKTGTDETTADHNGIGERFIDFLYKRLPPHLQEIWNEIEEWTGGPMGDDPSKKPKDAGERIDNLFERKGGKRARQSIFVAALVASNFSVVEACRKCNIDFSMYRDWAKEPAFEELFENINLMKKEFADSGVWRGIAAGDTAMIKWANSCINADKGWVLPARKLAAGDNGQMNLNVVVDVRAADNELEGLSLEERIALRDKVRAIKATQINPALPPIDLTPNRS